MCEPRVHFCLSGCLYFLPVVNRAAVNMAVLVSAWCDRLSFGCCPDVIQLGHMVVLFLVLRTSRLVSKVTVPANTSCQDFWSFVFLMKGEIKTTHVLFYFVKAKQKYCKNLKMVPLLHLCHHQ